MNKTVVYIITLILLGNFTLMSAQQREKKSILLVGASFASPGNGWFEIACRRLNVIPVNKAVNGETIGDTANRMINGTLYAPSEFDDLDALVIMQVHERDVADTSGLKENHLDYNIPFEHAERAAAAYDYVIKRYISECYRLKDDKHSKYYGTKIGKPAIIILCTHWHDARTVYNNSIRKLAQKWGFPLVEFDKYIGFSKNRIHPITKEQYSCIYTNGDTQKINGVVYGWHPERGEDKYIQQRMASIFVNTLQNIMVCYDAPN